MALRTVQFRYGTDNLGYLIHGKSGAVAVDGGAVEDICDYLSREGLELDHIMNTHSHGDHTCGNAGLAEGPERVVDVSDLPGMGSSH